MDVLDDRGFQKEVDTVRALHQTVVSLRAALERSRIEIEELKERIWSSESCELALHTLSVENHILRQKIIGVANLKETTTQTSIPYITIENFESQPDNKQTLDNNTHNELSETLIENSLNSLTDTSVNCSNKSINELNGSPAKSTNTLTKLHTRNIKSTEPNTSSVSSNSEVGEKKSPRQNQSQQQDLQKLSPRINSCTTNIPKSPKKSNQKAGQRSPNLKIESKLSNLKAESRSPRKINIEHTETQKSPQRNNLKTEPTVSPRKLELENRKLQTQKHQYPLSPKKLHFDHVEPQASPRKNKEQISPRKLKLDINEIEKSPRSHIKTEFIALNNFEIQHSPKTKLKIPRNSTFEEKTLNSPSKKDDTKLNHGATSTKLKNIKKPPRENHFESSEKKKSNPKIKNSVLSPRQTIVTVNVTLKSPKRNKQEVNKIKSLTLENNASLKLARESSKPSLQNETSDDNSIQELTVTNSAKTMEDPNEISGPAESEEDKIQEHKESDTDGDEVDDIELIFTTDETTSVIKEELVSIADGNEGDIECNTPVLLNYRTVDFETPDLHLSCDNMDKELEDDVFQENEEATETDNFENENTENLHFQNSSTQIHNSKSDNSINRDSINTENESQRDKSLKSCYSYQDSSFESRSLDKDESFDKFDDKEKYLHKMWSNNSVLVETDISKCGIVDPELPITSARRNTCPNPVPYRPIMHREALAKHNTRTLAVKFSSRNEDTPRPILNEKQSPKTESEAQTDISALPSLWKSESYLAHKVAHQFTTLPSKFPMPISQKSLRLSEKTKEARRVLLSDINFTSMVPELSRSADHLYQEGLEVMQTCGYGQYLNPPGPQLRRYNTGDSLTSPSFVQSQKFTWSPSDYSNFSSTKFDNSNMYLNRYRGSLTSINMQNSFDLPDNVKRRSYSTSHWRQNVPASFDNSRFMHSGK